MVTSGLASILLTAVSFYIEISWKEEGPGHVVLLYATRNENLVCPQIPVIHLDMASVLWGELCRSSNSGINNKLLQDASWNNPV